MMEMPATLFWIGVISVISACYTSSVGVFCFVFVAGLLTVKIKQPPKT